jgi:hypothetical protein
VWVAATRLERGYYDSITLEVKTKSRTAQNALARGYNQGIQLTRTVVLDWRFVKDAYQVIHKTNAGIDQQYWKQPDLGANLAKIVGSFQKRNVASFAIFSLDQNQHRDPPPSPRCWKIKAL